MEIAILGAGIGGLSTAIALKLKGIDAIVYEKQPQQTQLGAGIVCWPNACFVLEQLNMLEDITQKSALPEQMQRFSSTNENLGSLDITTLNELMGYPSYSILRKDLMFILNSHATNPGIEIKYNHQVTEIKMQNAAESEIYFNNNSSKRANLIIGADGRMNSVARRFVTENNQNIYPAIYQGFINWIGYIQSYTPLFHDLSIKDYWGTGSRFGIVPINAHCAYWAGGVAAAQITPTVAAAYKQELLSLFEHWPEPVRTIIMNSPTEQIHKIFVHDHNPLDCWHKDHVLLIGDAAHASLPTSGQGACQALEDAWHLANIIEKQAPQIDKIASEFTALRLAKTTEIIKTGRGLAQSLFNTDNSYCEQRNLNSKKTDFTSLIQAMSKGWSSGLPMGLNKQ